MKKIVLKRFISTVVAVLVMVSSFGVFAADEESVQVPEEPISQDGLQSIKLLESLKIELPEFESGADIVTRGEFLYVMMQGLGCKNSDISVELPFNDVSLGDYFITSLKYAVNMGIVSKADYFYPYRSITVNEAYKMMVVSLGMTYQANSRGGYPGGFYAVAHECDLNDGIKSKGDEPLSRNDFYVLAANFLRSKIYESSSIVDGDIVISNAQTVMERYFDVYETSGVVCADAFTSLYDSSASLGEGFVQVGDSTYKCSSLLKLGYKARIYVKRSSEKWDEIIYATYPDNNVIKVRADTVTYVNDQRFEYDIYSGKIKGLSLISSPAYIYNGKAEPKILASQIPQYDASIEFIDNDSNGRYDVVKIWESKDIFVDYVNTSDKYISGKNSMSVELADNPDKRYVITVDGEDATISDIKSGTVASCYVSRDELLINVAVSTSSVFGEVEEYDYSGKTIVIGKKSYKYSEEFEKHYINQASIGTKGTIFLSDIGIAVAFTAESSSQMEYGYFINIKKASGLSETVRLKLCTAKNGIMVFDAADKVIINDGTATSSNELLALLQQNGQAKEQVIRYGVNKDGKISKVDTQDKTGYLSGNESDLDNLTLYKLPTDAPASVYFLKSTSLVFPYFEIGDDTVMFRICTNTSLNEEQRYRAYNAKSFLSNVASSLKSPMVYNVAEGNVAGAVMVKTDTIGKNLNEYSAGGVIHSVTNALTDDGTRGLKVVIVSGQNYETYYINNEGLLKTIDASATFDNPCIAPGDAIRITVGDNETLEEIALDFDYSELKITCSTPQGHNDLCKYYFGKIYDKVGDKLMVVPKDVTDANPEINSNTQRYVWRASGYIPIFDTRTNEIYHSTIDDVRTYLSSGDACSKLLVRTSNGSVTYMVIYR